MMKFITLTINNTTEEVTVNADKIINFFRRPNMNYTVIDLEGKRTPSPSRKRLTRLWGSSPNRK